MSKTDDAFKVARLLYELFEGPLKKLWKKIRK